MANKRLAIYPLLVLANLSCCDRSLDASPLHLTTIGQHDTLVGITWSHPIGSIPASLLKCSLLEAPSQMGIISDKSGKRLVWLATVFDLGANKPGSPRIPGKVQPIRLQCSDSNGRVAETNGAIRAIPNPLTDPNTFS